jgi:hypothetical protein
MASFRRGVLLHRPEKVPGMTEEETLAIYRERHFPRGS